jgi:hypothetical protein
LLCNYTALSTHADADTANAVDKEAPQAEDKKDEWESMCELHRLCLQFLWQVADGESSLSDAVVARAVTAVEEIAHCTSS